MALPLSAHPIIRFATQGATKPITHAAKLRRLHSPESGGGLIYGLPKVRRARVVKQGMLASGVAGAGGFLGLRLQNRSQGRRR